MTRGIVLAAGMGSRLGRLTEALPKTLLTVDRDRTILDAIVANLVAVGVSEIALVVGFEADRIDACVPSIEDRHELRITVVDNDRLDRNNCYSLWLAMPTVTEPTLIVNGDTLHPVSVERALLAAPQAPITLAVDTARVLGAEAMKVVVGPDGTASRIHKQIATGDAIGEYIGVSLIEPAVAAAVAAALEATWKADPTLYYEDGFQRFLDGGGRVAVADIGDVDWVEVDDAADLARAREIAPGL
jgi:choline kinase